ncbi:MAG: hypothetical protein ABIF10_02545 [Candidatus Woesearchaeota archaeon]
MFGELIGRIEKLFSQITRNIEGFIDYEVQRLRKKLMKIALQGTILAAGIIFILAGAALFFSRFFSLDAVLIVGGLILLYIALLLNIWR